MDARYEALFAAVERDDATDPVLVTAGDSQLEEQVSV